MTKKDGWNYRAYNIELKCSCGHNHHSSRKAIFCAKHIGWTTDVDIERFYSPAAGYGKNSIGGRKRKLTIEEGRMWYSDLC